MIEYRVCSNPDCKQINPQPIENFHKSNRTKYGRQSRCKFCKAKYASSPDYQERRRAYMANYVPSGYQEVIEKTCSNPDCKQVKPQPAKNFYRDKRNRDGLQSQCKSCFSEKNKSEKVRTRQSELRRTDGFRQWRRNYEKYGKGREIRRRYAQSESGKEAQQRYRKSEKGKESARKSWKKSTYRHRKQLAPDQISARTTVRNAVRLGKMPRASAQICIQCGNQAQEYHHYLGYEKEHYLDVIPVCKKCHRDLEPSR